MHQRRGKVPPCKGIVTQVFFPLHTYKKDTKTECGPQVQFEPMRRPYSGVLDYPHPFSECNFISLLSLLCIN